MTLTVAEAEGRMAELVEQAVAGAEVVIASTRPQGAAVRLTPAAASTAAGRSRLEQHAELKGSLIILKPEELVKPLPPEEWGGWAD
jgi:antitoxin (DNA-binding transcriptional repressor) of toxin-antitoxin stability system